jgi:gliding motility-associatede transport system auxiliary component
MKPEWHRIARWAALIVAGLALLAVVGLLVVQHEWNLYLQISLGLMVIGLGVFVLLDPDAVRTALTGRQAHYGSNVLILAIAFIGILVVVNYLAFTNTKRVDLTADKSNTLAAETLDVLKSLPGTVTAKAFFSTDSTLATQKTNAQDLFDQYVYSSNGKFQYVFIDPIKDPTAAEAAGITKDGSIILYMGQAKQPVASVTEQEITGALVRLMNPGSEVVYFLTGHGELPIDGGSDQSFTQLKTALEAKNYTVNTLSLLATSQIPTDASVIVIAGPQKPLSDAEVSLLDAYLKNGGSLVVMEEPTILTQFGDAPDPLANYLAQTYGIVLGNDIVVDVQAAQSLQQPFVAIANQYAQHVITQKMSGMATFFPTARSVTTDDSVGSDYSRIKLILTASQSWAETDMASVQDGTMNPDQGVDTFGPISLAVVAQGTTNNARIAVFGDSDFATNTYYSVYGNGDMIVNTIDWAAKQENLINLSAKTTVDRTLITPKPYMMSMILLGSMIVLPGLVLVGGIVAWVTRRRQG